MPLTLSVSSPAGREDCFRFGGVKPYRIDSANCILAAAHFSSLTTSSRLVSSTTQATSSTKGNLSAVLHLAADHLVDVRYVDGEQGWGNRGALGETRSNTHWFAVLSVHTLDDPGGRMRTACLLPTSPVSLPILSSSWSGGKAF